MNLDRKIKPTNLSAWLEIATGDLVPSAQARIRSEIEAHYAEAVKSHQEAGLPETNAQAASLADLGNAHAAARRYNREYLTKEEAKRVASYFEDEDTDDPPPPILQRNRFLMFLNCNWALALLLCASIMTGLAARFDPDPEGFHGLHLVIVVCMLASLLLTWLVSKKLWQGAPGLAGQKITPVLLSRLILLDSLERLGWAAFFTSTFYVETDFLSRLMMASIAVRCSTRVIGFLHLRRKVLTTGVEGLDVPPQVPPLLN